MPKFFQQMKQQGDILLRQERGITVEIIIRGEGNGKGWKRFF